MTTAELTPALALLFGELVDGPGDGESFVLNGGDVGLLRSLDRLSAREASVSVHGGGSVAAHVEHLRFGLSLVNRWAAGENAFAGADWAASWRMSTVSDWQWEALRARLADEVRDWLGTLETPRAMERGDMQIAVATVAHLAYHLGAIRQIARAARGPSAVSRA